MHLPFKTFILSAAGVSLAACATISSDEQKTPDPEIVKVEEWRTVKPENLLIIAVNAGQIIIELNEDFAPKHTKQIRELSAKGIYDGETFYRVIDGFVAQGGLKDDERIAPFGKLANENDRPITTDGSDKFIPLGNGDLFAETVGHVDGFAAAKDAKLGREWLLHCPGAIAMARDEDPDSGSTEFYIVLDAQRYLDRNLTVFGRVLSGMQLVQAFKRGDRDIESGVIQAPAKGETILKMRTAADIPEAERPTWQVMNTNAPAFEEFKTAKRVRNEAFFYRKPPEVLDICSFSVPARKIMETADR